MLRELTAEERGLFLAHLPLCHAALRRHHALTARLGEAEALATAEDALWEATQAARPGYPLAPLARTVIHRRLLDACLRQGRRDERMASYALYALCAESVFQDGVALGPSFADRLEMVVFAAALTHWLDPEQQEATPPAQLAKALERLSDEDRSILWARMNDVPWTEVRDTVGMPERTAQRRFVKLIRRLRAIWDRLR